MSLDAKLLEIQSRNLALTKDAEANYGRYATLGNVMDVLRPVLSELGLLIVQAPNLVGPSGTPAMTTIVTDTESGEGREFATPLILDKQTSQGMGSACTYARRYALVAIFFLDADEDDDGKAGEAPVTKKRAAPRKKKEEASEPAAGSDEPKRVF